MKLVKKLFITLTATAALMAGASVMASADSTVPMTYLENGGSYNLEYILNKFNVFTSGTVRGSHIYGPIIAGAEAGKGNDATPVAGFTFSDYDQGVSSYIKGKIYDGQRATGQANTPQGCYQNEYVGTVNTVSSSGGNGYVNGSVYLYSNTNIFNTDSYVDFDAAFASIQKQSDTLYSNTTKELGVSDLVSGNYLYVTEGQNVKLSDELMDYNAALYAKSKSVITVVLVTDSTDASSKVNTVISVGKTGSSVMPAIHISSSVGDPGTLYPSSNELNKNGTSLIWNCPNATRLDFTNQNGDGLGHVVAPKADIYNLQGTYSGCQVCRNFYGNGSEGHMQPYNGTKIVYGDSTTVSKTVKKVWNDSDDQDGVRPSGIKVQLYAGETKSGDEVTLNADNSWTHEWTDLAEEDNGTKINYTVREVSTPDGYTSAITEDNGVFTLTNTHKAETVSRTVRKVWNDSDNQDGIRPAGIKVQLYAGETKSGDEVTLNADNNWTYEWKDLAKNSKGAAIDYSVREVSVPDGYTSAITEDSGTFTVTNTHAVTKKAPQKGSLTVTKKVTVDGMESSAISETVYIALFRDAACTDIVSGPKQIEIKDGTASAAEFTDIEPGTYYVAETNADGSSIYEKAVKMEGYDSGSIDGNRSAVTIEADKTSAAEITNRYTTPVPAAGKTTTTTTTTETTIPKKEAPEASGKAPKTGDDSHMIVWGAVAVLAAAELAVIRRRRQSRMKTDR